MTLDAYSLCPGGTGKRIKHCECRDIAGELEKIFRAIEGEQRVAALSRINRLLATHAHRPCLLALKTVTLLQMNNLQGVEETVATFTKVAPDNPLAHCFAATLEARKLQVRAAVDELQKARSLASGLMPAEIIGAYEEVGHALLNQGHFLAAVGHLEMSARLNSEEEENAAEVLAALAQSHRVPLALKWTTYFRQCPREATWRGRFESALRDARLGRWAQGLEKFEKLNQDFPQQPAICWNIGIARALLALPTAAEALHTYAACDDVPWSDALHAETVAQLLASHEQMVSVDMVRVTLPIADPQAVQERMRESSRMAPLQIKQWSSQDPNSPPPRAVFALLDRPLPEKDAELTAADAPLMLTQVLLYGKETDRPARLVYAAPDSDTFRAIPAALADIVGPQPADLGETREVLHQVNVGDAELPIPCYRPPEMPLAAFRRLSSAVLQERFRTRWPHLRLRALDDKAPAEVADDPAYRIRLAAAVEVITELVDSGGWEVDLDQLWHEVHLPSPEPIDPTDQDVTALSPMEWSRVLVERLTDDQLRVLWSRADGIGARRPALRFGAELLRRKLPPSERSNLSDLCVRLAYWAANLDQTIEYLDLGRQFAVADGASAAPFLLREFPIRIRRGESREALELLRRLQRDHLREPGVADALYQLLEQYGLLPESPAAAEDAAPMAAEAAAAATPAATLWTGEDTQAASPAEPKPSKLWLPD